MFDACHVTHNKLSLRLLRLIFTMFDGARRVPCHYMPSYFPYARISMLSPCRHTLIDGGVAIDAAFRSI